MKTLKFKPPLDTDLDNFSVLHQIAFLISEEGLIMDAIRGSTAPNPRLPGKSDKPNMSEYPIVKPGEYMGVFSKDGHKKGSLLYPDGRPCIRLMSDGPVPILQEKNPRYPDQGPFALAIRVHEVYKNSWRGSAGCMTLEPGADNWMRRNFEEGEAVKVIIPDQSWFANR